MLLRPTANADLWGTSPHVSAVPHGVAEFWSTAGYHSSICLIRFRHSLSDASYLNLGIILTIPRASAGTSVAILSTILPCYGHL
jgi:hypothetical protein